MMVMMTLRMISERSGTIPTEKINPSSYTTDESRSNYIQLFYRMLLLGSGGGGGEVSEYEWGCAILALEVVPKNLISS